MRIVEIDTPAQATKKIRQFKNKQMSIRKEKKKISMLNT